MSKRHKIKSGEDIASLAYENGLLADKIWNDPENNELNRARDSFYVLNPGDVVMIPEVEQKTGTGGTEERHRFRRKGVPETLVVRILDDDREPLANEAYRLILDGHLIEGTTDQDGILRESIQPNAEEARLIINSTEEEYTLQLGGLDPIDTVKGMQERLNNLGFACGAEDDDRGEFTEASLSKFREVFEMPDDGDDDSLLQRIKNQHGA